MGVAERYKFLHTVVVDRPIFFRTLTCLKGPHTGGAERPKFFTLKTEGPHMGVAERYKFFKFLNIPKDPHMGGSKRPKFLFTPI